VETIQKAGLAGVPFLGMGNLLIRLWLQGRVIRLGNEKSAVLAALG
jgi:hypothetical protein